MFDEFMNKKVKIVFDDFGKPNILKGVLTRVDNHFVYLKGYQEQAIAINKIVKIKIIR